MTIELTFALARGASIHGNRGRAWFSERGADDFGLPHDLLEGIAAVAAKEMSTREIEDFLALSGNMGKRQEFFTWLEVLIDRGLLRSALKLDGIVIASRLGLGMRSSLGAPRQGTFCLSRFAYCRIAAGELVIESPTSSSRIILNDPRAAAALHFLCAPFEVGSILPVGEEEAVRHGLAVLLIEAGVMVPAETIGESDWEFHDLLFHMWSRYGQVMLPYGRPPLSGGTKATRPLTGASFRVNLPKPDGEEGLRLRGFTQVLEARKSVRKHREAPVSITELGHFLYRTAACRAGSDGMGTRFAYPSWYSRRFP